MKKLFILFILIVSTSFNSLESVKTYNEEISELPLEQGYNSDYVFLVDYAIPSGKRRFFIYNLKTREIEKRFLVAHGSGCPSINGVPTFSNVVGSNCSSRGLMVLGERDYSRWGIGIKYWLDGKDKSNSNVRKRVIVLHSWGGIPDREVFPFTIAESQGCLTVSNRTMRYLDRFIQKQDNKRILIHSFK